MTRNLGPALETLKSDIGRMGAWNRKQVVAVVVFVVMLLGWITEKNLLLSIAGIRLGIGVIAMAGAIAYLLLGVVNWRDYHEKVDWGVVWLYAGAIIFGRMLDQTGAAYWMARSVVETLAGIGMGGGQALLVVGSAVTSFMTNLMADGPAAAAVGPVTLNMASVANPGTTLIPSIGFSTACASSFAYLLIIGTPSNAIVYASGYLEPKDFLRVGIPCFIIVFLVLVLLLRNGSFGDAPGPVTEQGRRTVLVFDEDDRFVGCLRIVDVLGALIPKGLIDGLYSTYLTGMFAGQCKILDAHKIEEIVDDPVYIDAEAPLMEAVHLMAKNSVINLPVLEKGKLVGVLRDTDLLAEAARYLL